MENKKEEQLIYIKDLIFAALCRWKAVLAVALILGILLGGMQAVSDLSAADTATDPAVLQAAQEQYAQDKADLEQRVEKAKNALQSHQDYLADALLMQLDPYSHYEVQLSLYVHTDYKIQPGMSYQDPDRTASVLTAYEAVLRGSAAMDAMAKALQTESRYLSEVFTTEKDATTATLLLRVKLPTQEAAQTLLPMLTDQVSAAQEQVEASVVDCQLSVVEQSVITMVDADVANQQQKHKDQGAGLEKAVADAEAALSALAAPAAGGTVSKNAVIFAVLGAVVGAFLTVCILWGMHIASDRIYAARNLYNRTGVKVIGTVGCKKKNPIDRMLYRLEGRAADGLETSPLAVDIRCRAKDAKHLLITGSGKAEDRQALVSAIAQAMPGVRVEDRGSILQDAGALEALTACDAVVLVEQNGVSRYSAVQKQLDLISDYGTVLLGCVLLEK